MVRELPTIVSVILFVARQKFGDSWLIIQNLSNKVTYELLVLLVRGIRPISVKVLKVEGGRECE